MVEKVIVLERAIGTDGQLGSFGFSILGGAGTKFPAVVCEVDPQGPADLTEKVYVGDQLLMLNGERLVELTPKDLVQRIRTAPSPSEFVLGEDKDLRQQVVALLRKKSRAAAASSSDLKGRVRDHRKVSAPSLSNSGIPGEEKRRRGRHERIIEVEPSVNINEGRGGDIVKVLDNRIIGKVDQRPRDKGEVNQRQSPQPFSPPSPSQQNRKKGSIPSEGSSPPGSLTALTNSSRSPKVTSGSAHSLEHKPTLGPPHAYPTTVKSTSMDSFKPTSSGHPTGTPVLNGDTRSYSDSSGLNSISENASMPAHEEKMRLSNERSNVTETSTGSGESPHLDHGHDARLAIHVPGWSGPMRQKPRGSLAEELLVGGSKEDSPSSSPNISSQERAKYPLLSSNSREELMRKYRSANRSSSKRRQDPYADAVVLARRLYMLDGYKKSEVAQQLADMSEHGQTVAREYLKFFEFEGVTLDKALRQFLSFFSLTGESQERERVMVYFSERYFECNPDTFLNPDTVHGLTIAMLLLNTDMHTNHGRHKMTFPQFVSNLQQIRVSLPKDMLKRMYDSIKRTPLEWAFDDDEGEASHSHGHPSPSHTFTTNHSTSSREDLEDETVRTYHVTIPGTFVEVEMPGNATLFKEGFVMKKNIMDGPHKKVPRGKRQWKPYYAYLKGFLLYFAPPNGELHLDNTSSAVTISHCLAMRAADYHKKASVVRVTTSDWHAFLLQTSNVTDMQQWIGAINKAAGLYSSPPLAAPVSSSSHFQRPTFPLAPTKNTQQQQVECHESKIKSLEKELEEHQAYKPKGSKAKHGQLQDWFDKFEFLQFEINRFRIYLASITSDVVVDYNAPLPSGLVPSPSINTLATPGVGDDGEVFGLALTPPQSPSRQKLAHQKYMHSLIKQPGTRKDGKYS